MTATPPANVVGCTAKEAEPEECMIYENCDDCPHWSNKPKVSERDAVLDIEIVRTMLKTHTLWADYKIESAIDLMKRKQRERADVIRSNSKNGGDEE